MEQDALDIAEHLLALDGITGIIIRPRASTHGATELAIRPITSIRRAQHPKIWFRSKRDAERALQEIMGDPRSRRRGERVLVQAEPGQVVDLLTGIARLDGVRVLAEADVTATIQNKAAALADLNTRHWRREYRKERRRCAAIGEPPPPQFCAWIAGAIHSGHQVPT
jgi:hypothetical protein